MTFFAQRKAWASYQLLVEAGAIDINYTGEVYSDMLSIAVSSGECDRVRFCLKHGADPNLNRIEDYKTVLASAAEEGYIDITALLLEYGAVLNGSGALVLAAEDGKLEMVKYLLGRGADIDEVGVEHPHDPMTKEDVGSALHHAIEDRHIEVARFLIQSGASLDLKNGRGKSAREQAEEEGLVELVEMMRNGSEYR
ncbi:hypothetical protein ASPWEDRAFT_174912 [Aspergillus wentii DTO 134E9]|uniref:Uncharacterized protein n=1 Tax=Aspergillus wentii DTO 134E9 TaxID=1073089 RepID=A0A1L9RF03_ASPWE|nr:uncharacterized protein ASPWEDRAFT_174912 [Aspergillus wentii DTO 134E9]OJJ33509.1 hypothetical protein ASPWEDRAFT_174912 [Aspergillus wentii DTO 134E9]